MGRGFRAYKLASSVAGPIGAEFSVESEDHQDCG